MNVSYFGHSCFMVQLQSCSILFDPFISPNDLAKSIDISKIKPDYIFVSHAHEDHIADLITIAKQSNAKVIAVWEIYAWLQKQGIMNSHPVNTGGFVKFPEFSIQVIQAVHSSSFPDGSYGGNPVGFVISTKKKAFYYSGDTALFSDMKLIPKRHKLDFAFLPIGSNFTMDAEDASIAAGWLGVHTVIGMHYDTFGFIKINHANSVQIFKSKGIDLKLMEIGASLKI
jgi:L-ascorbate metabolism protein UlaG (beta-lactamase superfamily)